MRDYGGAVDMMNEIEEAERAYAESARLFREAGDESAAAEADFRLGINAYHRGDVARARQLFESSLRTFERFDDDARTLQVLGGLGTLEFERGNFDRGWELTERSCAMAQAAGWTWWEVLSLTSLAERTLEVGRIDEAERRILDPLERGRRMGDRWTKIRGILVMARVALERGDVERAAMLWAVVEDEHARAPIPRWQRLQARYAGHLSHLARPTEVPTLDAAVELVLEDARD
jgi:tetratricopeptide (TPR) repeat protein